MSKLDLHLVVTEIRHERFKMFGALTLWKNVRIKVPEARLIGIGGTGSEEDEIVCHFHPDEEKHALVMSLDEGEALANNMLRKIANARRMIIEGEKLRANKKRAASKSTQVEKK